MHRTANAAQSSVDGAGHRCPLTLETASVFRHRGIPNTDLLSCMLPLGTHPKGYFCVTESSNAGCYTLSMKTMRKGQDITKLLLIPVEQPDGDTHYKTGKHGDKSFPSVVDLVEYHMKHSGIKAHARGQSFKKQIAQADADDEEC